MNWARLLCAVLGGWLATLPFAFELPSPAMRSSAVVSGLVLVGLSMVGVAWARWATAVVGGWLMLAPLVFWAESPLAYDSSTLVGVLLVALALVLGAPLGAPASLPAKETALRHLLSKEHRGVADGPSIPPGWSYNPSAFAQRAPIVAIAFLSYLVARHLATYQLGYIAAPWDPIFGDGTRTILESDVSKAFPVSDAGLGAVTYLLEALSGMIGGERRWRTMPWIVILFGIMIVPLGIVSITLVMLQPVAVGAWCALCLLTAVLMLVMISPAVDEVIASLLLLARVKREGGSLWNALWYGALPPDEPEPGPEPRHGLKLPPLSLAFAAAIGIWVMASPGVLGLSGMAADTRHIVGPLAVTFAVISMAEIIRIARYALVPLGLWLVVATLIGQAAWSGLVAGLLLCALAIPRGAVSRGYGEWSRFVR